MIDGVKEIGRVIDQALSKQGPEQPNRGAGSQRVGVDIDDIEWACPSMLEPSEDSRFKSEAAQI
jgi:hypothetical protein